MTIATTTDTMFVSTDRATMDVTAIWDMLSRSYWAATRTKEIVEKSIAQSVCVGIFVNGKQVGFARAVTDHVTVAALFDVIVHEDFRNRGFGKRLVQEILNHQELAEVEAFMLATRPPADGLYAGYGFRELPKPGKFMSFRKSWVVK